MRKVFGRLKNHCNRKKMRYRVHTEIIQSTSMHAQSFWKVNKSLQQKKKMRYRVHPEIIQITSLGRLWKITRTQ